MNQGGKKRVAASAALLLLCGCSPAYVLRAGYEEMRILWRRQPIEELLRSESIDPETRAKLELTLAVRSFARDLGLSVGESYSSLSRVDADQVVYIVTAAKRDRLEPYTWWFPIVGRVPYRGYFDREDALRLASELERDGYDTYVRPAIAFSTLGWFDDPLLSNLLRYDQVTLASTIIHELLHNTIYLSGKTSFNESFGNFVGWRGAIEYFDRYGKPSLLQHARAVWADELLFSRLLGEMVQRLQVAYERGIDLEDRQRLLGEEQDRLRSAAWKVSPRREFTDRALNNAIILHQWLYAHDLHLFERAFARRGEDLGATIEWIRTLAEDVEDPFVALAQALEIDIPTTARRSLLVRSAARVAHSENRQACSMASSRRCP
jgi:predicted aminopeptidase